MKRYRIAAILALICVAGCQRRETNSPAPADTGGADPTGSLAASVAVPAYNLGDVDVATVPSVELSERSRSQYISYEELRNLRKELSIANANVRQPLPSELWVIGVIDSAYGYRDSDAVLAHVELKLDNRPEPVVVKDYVWSGKTLQQKPETFEADIMPFLAPVPESVLVQLYVTLYWFPDTDASTIMPGTADLTKAQKHEKRSNPLRINFQQAGV